MPSENNRYQTNHLQQTANRSNGDSSSARLLANEKIRGTDNNRQKQIAGSGGYFRKMNGKGFNRVKKNVLVIMDSNQKFINFRQLFRQHGSATVERIYTLNQAIQVVKEEEWKGPHPTDIILHVGTNDIDHYRAGHIMDLTVELVDEMKKCFPQAVLHVSELIPRA